MFVTELIGSLFIEMLSEFCFLDWFVISTFHIINSKRCVAKRTFDEFPEMTSVEAGDKSFQFKAVDNVQHSDHAGVTPRSLSYAGDVINPLNAELNPISHLPALLGTHHILHVSRIRVKAVKCGDKVSF